MNIYYHSMLSDYAKSLQITYADSEPNNTHHPSFELYIKCNIREVEIIINNFADVIGKLGLGS